MWPSLPGSPPEARGLPQVPVYVVGALEAAPVTGTGAGASMRLSLVQSEAQAQASRPTGATGSLPARHCSVFFDKKKCGPRCQNRHSSGGTTGSGSGGNPTKPVGNGCPPATGYPTGINIPSSSYPGGCPEGYRGYGNGPSGIVSNGCSLCKVGQGPTTFNPTTIQPCQLGLGTCP